MTCLLHDALWAAAAAVVASPFAVMLIAPLCGINARHNPTRNRAGRQHRGRP